MSAYIVTIITVTDPAKFEQYRNLAGPAVAQYGGKFLVRGGARTILEGKFDANRLVVLEFPSSEMAKTFYSSPEYRAARDKRIGAADFNMVLVEGV
ncbi:MAG: DUF1330 domain-containing protein [Pseudomonadota bacterium]|nr:DUF1330 domain-containing protein [Pseudomonadota bacterium]